MLMENRSPSISVLMSVFNPNEEYLREAMESILSQSHKDFEFIIIIDGIDKKVLSIIKSYEDRRIKIYQNSQNIGLTKSLNIGVQLAKGKYIARMDADDVSLPNRLAKQFKYMEENEGVTVVGTLAKYIGRKGIVPQHWSPNEEVLKIRMLFYNAGIIHPSAFIRKEFLDRHNIKYDECIKKSQDYALWVDLMKYGGKIKLIPEVLLGYRRHPNQITSNSVEVEYYTNVIRLRQWDHFGLEFSDLEKNTFRSISSAKIDSTPIEFNKLFRRLIQWNDKKRCLDQKLLKAEIVRLWCHLALKSALKGHNFKMLFNSNTIKLFKPANFFYIIKFYL
jgi:glycosyltransferase involved in cell wall biosynthesis